MGKKGEKTRLRKERWESEVGLEVRGQGGERRRDAGGVERLVAEGGQRGMWEAGCGRRLREEAAGGGRRE